MSFYYINTNHLTEEFFVRQAGEESYWEGLDMANSGTVKNMQAYREITDEYPVIINSFSTDTSYSYRFPRQEIALKNDPNSISILSQCDCFNHAETMCPHVVATLISLKRHIEKENARGKAPAIMDWVEGYKRKSAQSHSDQNKSRFIYCLEIQDNVASIRIRQCKLKASGDGWTNGSIYNLHSEKLFHKFQTDPAATPQDIRIAKLLHQLPSDDYHRHFKVFALEGADGHFVLEQLLQTGRLFYGNDAPFGPISEGSPRPLPIRWHKSEGGSQFFVDESSVNVLMVDPPLYLEKSVLTVSIGPFDEPQGLNLELLYYFRNAPFIPNEYMHQATLSFVQQFPMLPSPPSLDIVEEEGQCSPVLKVFKKDHAIVNEIALDYGYFSVNPGYTDVPELVERDGKLIRVIRDIAYENALVNEVINGIHEVQGETPEHRDGNLLLHFHDEIKNPIAYWFEYIEAIRSYLERRGWDVHVEDDGLKLTPAGEVGAAIGLNDNDWFSLRFDVTIGQDTIPLLPLISQVIGHYDTEDLPETLYLETDSHGYISIPSAKIAPVLRTIEGIYSVSRGQKGYLPLTRGDATNLTNLENVPLSGDTTLFELGQRLAKFDGIKEVTLPKNFKGELRRYQQDGLNWLQFLREFELGGVLADDMGLGKTIQTIANIAVEKRGRRLKKPCLVISTTSAISHWRNEAERFAPHLKTLLLQGPERAELFPEIAKSDIVLSTYPLIFRDHDTLSQQEWHYIVLDEAHKVKNSGTKTAQLLRELESNHRLCLTGTPIQNNLSELWAHFDFLMPKFLGNKKYFQEEYRRPIEKGEGENELQVLRNRVKPFILRREKRVVDTDLPPKTTIIRDIQLEDTQAELYEGIRLSTEDKVLTAMAQKGADRIQVTVLDALLRLRQACCDPRILPEAITKGKAYPSAKFHMLFEMLDELLPEGRRVLIFSQFTKMLRLIRAELENRTIPHLYLEGSQSQKKREKEIALFQEGDTPVYLISLKAGGEGINLTAADTVIHYDPWWNPMIEEQAASRAHRRGQEKPVFEYKLVAEGTVEEKIIKLHQKKMALAEGILGGDGKTGSSKFDEEMIRYLFSK